jgi:head-tail adaptor
MSASLDLSNDFAVFDGAETVTLRGPRTSSGVEPTAVSLPGLRRKLTVREIEASGGKYAASDVRWHLPEAELPSAPALGSVIVDADGRAWTILEATRVTLGSRWSCTARRWEIAAGLSDLVTVLRATWTKSASGVPVAEWTEVRRGAVARVQPIEVRVEGDAATMTIRATHRCFLAEPIEVTSELRVRRGDELYAVLGVDDAERLDRGMTLLLERLNLEVAS